MSIRLPAKVVAGALTAIVLSACSGGSAIDGKYYNSRSGEFAMELKNGKATSIQGMEGKVMNYVVRGDSLILSDPAGGPADQLAFGIERDGTLSLGILGSLTKNKK